MVVSYELQCRRQHAARVSLNVETLKDLKQQEHLTISQSYDGARVVTTSEVIERQDI
jgi:hypothetical protein